METSPTTASQASHAALGSEENAGAKHEVRGVRILTLSIALMVISLILCVLVAVQTYEVADHYEKLNRLTSEAALCNEAAVQAERGSDYLTNECRFFAVTGNSNHVRNYFAESNDNKNRDIALANVRSVYPDQEVLDTFEGAIEKSMKLMETEEYAMSLIILSQGYRPEDVAADLANVEISSEDLALSPNAKYDKGYQMLFDDNYNKAKGAIDSDLASIWQLVSEKSYYAQEEVSQQLSSALFWQRLFIFLLIIMAIVTFLMIIMFVVRPLRMLLKNVETDEKLSQVGSYEFRYLAKIYNEMYDLKLENERLLEDKAEHDPLTAILNRRAFDKAVEELHDVEVPICLMMVDVDNFKQINDKYGHAMGDKVLCMIAELLESRFRTSDYIARLGGDEFAVIAVNLPFADIDIMRLKFEGIRERLANPRGGIPPVSISVGCSFSEHGLKDEMIEQADQAMYQVKQDGRNGFKVFQ